MPSETVIFPDSITLSITPWNKESISKVPSALNRKRHGFPAHTVPGDFQSPTISCNDWTWTDGTDVGEGWEVGGMAVGGMDVGDGGISALVGTGRVGAGVGIVPWLWQLANTAQINPTTKTKRMENVRCLFIISKSPSGLDLIPAYPANVYKT